MRGGPLQGAAEQRLRQSSGSPRAAWPQDGAGSLSRARPGAAGTGRLRAAQVARPAHVSRGDPGPAALSRRLSKPGNRWQSPGPTSPWACGWQLTTARGRPVGCPCPTLAPQGGQSRVSGTSTLASALSRPWARTGWVACGLMPSPVLAGALRHPRVRTAGACSWVPAFMPSKAGLTQRPRQALSRGSRASGSLGPSLAGGPPQWGGPWHPWLCCPLPSLGTSVSPWVPGDNTPSLPSPGSPPWVAKTTMGESLCRVSQGDHCLRPGRPGQSTEGAPGSHKDPTAQGQSAPCGLV